MLAVVWTDNESDRPDSRARTVPAAPGWRRMALATLSAALLSGPAIAIAGSLLDGFTDDQGSELASAPISRPLTLLAFGYTSCPDVCPLTLLAVHQALVQLGRDADRVAAYFVTVDPERDSVARLHQYVGSFDERIRALRGPDASLEALTGHLKVRYWREALYPDSTDYVMSHTATLFLLDQHQHVLARIPHDDRADVLAGRIVREVKRRRDR
jgi:protein SCO1/2